MSEVNEKVQGEAPSTPSIDQLTQVYIKMRDAKEELTAEYKKKVAGIDEQMQIIESELLENCKSLNASSIRTPHGTVIRSVKSRYWTNDWDSMHTFIAQNHAFGLLEKRLHQSNMKQWLEENPDLEPAGLNVDKEFTVIVRRSK